MDNNEVYCELLTKENVDSLYAALDKLSESDKLTIDRDRLKAFLEHPQNLAFISILNGEICGFIYGYSLMALDAAPQLFIYSVDVFNNYQNKGIGSKLFQYAVDYSRKNGFSECFVITDKGNKRACRIYEKAGGKNDYEDEIVYVIKHNNQGKRAM